MKNQWHSLELGSGTEALDPSRRIIEAFAGIVSTKGDITASAIYSRHDLEKNMVTAYFSPEASALAALFGAKPCDRPNPDDRLGLLVGDRRLWADHFSDH